MFTNEEYLNIRSSLEWNLRKKEEIATEFYEQYGIKSDTYQTARELATTARKALMAFCEKTKHIEELQTIIKIMNESGAHPPLRSVK